MLSYEASLKEFINLKASLIYLLDLDLNQVFHPNFFRTGRYRPAAIDMHEFGNELLSRLFSIIFVSFEQNFAVLHFMYYII